MQHASPWIVQNKISTLSKLREPTVVFGIDPVQGQGLQADNRPMVRMVNLRDSSEVFYYLPSCHEQAIKFLLKGMPLALGCGERSGKVHEEMEFPPFHPSLTENSSYRNLVSVRYRFIRMTCRWELILPGMRGLNGSTFIRNT